ncbi:MULTISPECIES: tRNA uridine-5-carboxymethylaminomethyl(34) synthesis GTPase MnmE [unclassified Beijerinckia]|uniref:tRNA uridine-5-carboxymethylaminomethyl(34) synthesis GTPase MnmE n=1 Tax=unclassified Beijerinckia TaxID=2638183 RepID=UPI000896262A|nr:MULTISPECIES: tRNA uridine-5-carboxymethylaminomethyl(34) synthesis GTPase MnmE [unclassified Beijerinckia]MDH7798001.1 tRNA modification GTPase [Beijerinckia sp. GAS462]SED05574.1 tRNA modification GTPase [Beijerinckia sp. 28-YEA-48]
MADTIFAVSSGMGRSAVAVIRISGPEAGPLCRSLIGSLPAPRHAQLAALRDPNTQDILDRGLVLWFPGPHSFTGEDSVELQIHGGRASIAAVLRVLGAHPSCRSAEPGEFTKRAFTNGKMDLVAVEGLADLIDAQTDLQRRQALNQTDGALARQIDGLRESLIEVMALVEASIDFADEGEAPAFEPAQLAALLQDMRMRLTDALASYRRAEIVREGFTVLLSGPPNAGKSSLLNHIAGREAAIVSDIPGTTRDLLEVTFDLEGLPVVLIDSAGIHEAGDEVERIGIERARSRSEHADLVLWLSDRAETDVPLVMERDDRQSIRIRTKTDMGRSTLGGLDVAISTRTGEGVDTLLALVRERLFAVENFAETAVVTSARQFAALSDAVAGINRALMRIAGQPEVLAEELRSVAVSLGRVSGRIGVEDLLDSIFARFCFGK